MRDWRARKRACPARVRDQGPQKLACLAELDRATTTGATMGVAPEPKVVRSETHDKTEAGDQAVARDDAPLADRLGGRDSARGTTARRWASASGTDAARGAGVVDGTSPVRCAVCGRPGRFIRTGPLRRLRHRQPDRALRSGSRGPGPPSARARALR